MKLEQREERTLGNIIPELRSPARIAIGCECGGVVRFGRSGVTVRFHIRGRRVVDVRVHRSDVLGSEGDTIIVCSMDLMKSIESCFHVTRRWFVAIGSKEGMGSNEARASRVCKPTYATNEALVCLLTPLERRRVLTLHRLCYHIDRNARPIRRSRRCLIVVCQIETIDKMGGKTGLTEMNGDHRRGNAPREVDAKEPIDDTHEVNFAAF
jgi:hypothetical protein